MQTVACSYIILKGATMVATVPSGGSISPNGGSISPNGGSISPNGGSIFQTAAVFFQTAAVFSKLRFALPVATIVAPKRAL
jgi:hypothetical protein